MKRILFILFAGILMASCIQQTETANQNEEQEETITKNHKAAQDGVFIHISEGYEDAHRVLMPMKMATIMANDKDVLIYMDIHAVELAVKGAKDLEHDGFDSFQTYLKQLNEMGVEVYACPTCLEVAGYTADDLTDGIQPAKKDRFFNFTKGRIITLDY